MQPPAAGGSQSDDTLGNLRRANDAARQRLDAQGSHGLPPDEQAARRRSYEQQRAANRPSSRRAYPDDDGGRGSTYSGRGSTYPDGGSGSSDSGRGSSSETGFGFSRELYEEEKPLLKTEKKILEKETPSDRVKEFEKGYKPWFKKHVDEAAEAITGFKGSEPSSGGEPNLRPRVQPCGKACQ
jgi:hypothetical protein